MIQRPLPDRFRGLAATGAALGLTTLFAGCGVPDLLRIDDRNATIASVRGVVRLGSDRNGGPGLELDAGRFRGRSPQDLDSFQTITLNGQSIAGPTRVDNVATSQHVQLAYNHRLFPGRAAELEWFAGVNVTQLDWRTTSARTGDPALRRRHSWYGPGGGVTGRLNLGPMAALELRASGTFDVERSLFSGGTRRTNELALALRPVPGVQLRLGFAEASSSFEAEPGNSDLTMRARGPFVGLAFGY